MGILWPSTPKPDPSLLARFGRITHWLFTLLAGLGVVAALEATRAAVSPCGWGRHFSYGADRCVEGWGDLPSQLGMTLTMTAIAFLIGRGARYLFSGE